MCSWCDGGAFKGCIAPNMTVITSRQQRQQPLGHLRDATLQIDGQECRPYAYYVIQVLGTPMHAIAPPVCLVPSS